MKYEKKHLFGYPNFALISEGVKQAWNDIRDRWQGAYPLHKRWAGRTFCRAANRIRIHPSCLEPIDLGVQLDEDWICCTSPIVTGVTNKRTGQAPFREGEAVVITPDGEFVMLQHLIEEMPDLTIGKRLKELTRNQFGKPTWPAVSKKFDNVNPIPHHLHLKKKEVYDINPWDNPGVHRSHYLTTAIGLCSWVEMKHLLPCFSDFDSGEYNRIRDFSPHHPMPVGQFGYGFTMRNGILHSPTNLCTHELHMLMDEHLLMENVTLDGAISAEDAWLAVREEDLQDPSHRGDWELFLRQYFEWDANRNPNLIRDNRKEPIPAKRYCQDEDVKALWIVYGRLEGEPTFSILRLIVKPGAHTKLNFDSPFVFHVNQGEGQVCNLYVRLNRKMEFGKLYYEQGFVDFDAVSENDGINIANTGKEPFVLTLDFPAGAHSFVPGED
jgi:hypothetical protein